MDTFLGRIPVSSQRVLLVHHQILTGNSVSLPFPYGVILPAAYFYALTGEHLRNVEVRLQGNVVVHLATAHKFPGWSYIQMWSNKEQQYRCSCYEAKVCGYCSHIHDLEQQESILA
jgi:hypothetical protein